jgi:YXWGXW repeat-containing protein
MIVARFIRSISISFLLLGGLLLASPSESNAQITVGVAVTFGPPELPVYEQPLCPGEGYIWTPGYWAWDDDDGDYYWVPGTWVMAPEVGFFWTPGYWGWGGSSFVFYQGYWGPVVGFYGGINYGYGYFGHGYEGGRWDNGHFYYNRTVNNINVTEIHNVYNTKVVVNNGTRVSYNGGNGGLNERPTSQEQAAMHERHVPPVAAQVQHVQAARSNQSLRASVNHGRPPVAATPRPAAFNGSGVVAASKGGHYNPPPKPDNRGTRPTTVAGPAGASDRPNKAFHPNDLPPVERHPAPSSGDSKVDQKYQQQQEKLQAQQDRERQKLQQKQAQEHQRMAKQQANEAKKQQVEQKHQQQTQQLQQKHVQQQQRLEQRQQSHSNPPPSPAKPKH